MSKIDSSIDIVCALGNPGDTYVNTRHNIGFCMIDHFLKDLDVISTRLDHHCLVSTVQFNQSQIYFVKPMLFMNHSGKALFSWLNYYKKDISRVLLVYDDVDLALGQFRIRQKGSAGTHNGVKDVIAWAKTTAVSRLRVGIHSECRKGSLSDFVLGDFSKSEQEKLAVILDQSTTIMTDILMQPISVVMGKYN